jgi:hypothetical protein
MSYMQRVDNQLAFPLESEASKASDDANNKKIIRHQNAITIVVKSCSIEQRPRIIEEIRIILQDFDISLDRETSEGWLFQIHTKAAEKCRDKLKTIFFEIYLNSKSNKLFCLDEYIEFIVPLKHRVSDLLEHTFVHGTGRFYRFLLNLKKLPARHGLLAEYLFKLPQDCPNHLFIEGPKASKGNWAFPLKIEKITDNDLTTFACKGTTAKLMKRPHENLERFLIEYDENTFACEVPIWLQRTDYSDYAERFGTEQCITGHIDVLRINEEGCIEVWDYKPKADKEKNAGQQIWLYMLMLSNRTGIPLKSIRGGYFDEKNAFSVNLI